MRTFWQDLRFGLRLIIRTPGASLIAILALGLGIGANTAIFSVANGMLLHPLPYAHLNRLLDLSEVPPHDPPSSTNTVSAFNYATWKQQAHAFQAMAAYGYIQENVSGAGTPVMIMGAEVSANFFHLLPSALLAGRTFLPGEDRPGHERQVVLSRSLWEHQFAGDPSIIGRTIELNQQAYTVIGIVGQDAVTPPSAQLWIPLALTPEELANRGRHNLRVVGELAPGATLEQARTELRAIAARVDARYPATNSGWGVNVQTLANRTVGGETASYVLLLMGAVGFLLLIACANVANLQFARALGRSQELALRVALGAGRWRLMRQLLTENILLGILGGAIVGIAFAAVSIRLILVNMPADVAQFIGGWDRIRLDGTALLFTLAVAVLAGLLAGLAPAWHAARPQLNATLKEGGRGAIGSSRQRLRAALVALQIALAMVLLVGAALMVTGFRSLLDAGAPYQPARTLTANMNLPHALHTESPAQQAVFYQQVLGRVQALPGVRGIALASFLPLSGGYNMNYFSIEGRPVANASQQRYAVPQSISPNFFSLLNIPLVSGRAFTASDGVGAPPVAIISQRTAQRYWPGRNALGEHIKLGSDSSTSPWMTIIGVVGNVKWAWNATVTVPTLYTPVAQQPQDSTVLLVRGAGNGDVTGLAPALRRTVAAVAPDSPLFSVMSLQKSIHEASIGIAYVAVMLTIAGVLALVLAAIGVYGVMAFLVGERGHEFGIRRALGASHGDIVGLVLRRGAGMLAWGFALGLPLAFVIAHVLQSLIVGVGASQADIYFLICALLAAMAFIACYIPAHQATRVDPLTALRDP